MRTLTAPFGPFGVAQVPAVNGGMRRGSRPSGLGTPGNVRRSKNRQNEARMYMKTKGNDKKSGSADRRFCGLRFFRGRWGKPQTADRAVPTTKSPEQSQNVYENKGEVQKVQKGRSVPLCLCGSDSRRTKPECI